MSVPKPELAPFRYRQRLRLKPEAKESPILKAEFKAKIFIVRENQKEGGRWEVRFFGDDDDAWFPASIFEVVPEEQGVEKDR